MSGMVGGGGGTRVALEWFFAALFFVTVCFFSIGLAASAPAGAIAVELNWAQRMKIPRAERLE